MRKLLRMYFCTLAVNIVAASANVNELQLLLKDGIVLHVAGVVNQQWEEFSAFGLANACGFTNIDWEYLRDNTVSSLTLTVIYPMYQSQQIIHKLSYIQDSVDYYDCTDTVDLQTAVIDF